MPLINYEDNECIEKLVSETITEDDLLELFNCKNFRLTLAEKLGYVKIGDSYAYHNQDGNIEEDFNMRKLIKHIENNETLKNRFLDRAILAVKEIREMEKK